MVWNRTRRLWKAALPLALCFLLSFDDFLPSAGAQEPPAPARIRIVVVQGDGAVSGIRVPVSREPVVRVEDDDMRPISGATIVFALPVSGATGEFAGGAKTQTAQTDSAGLATARGLRTGDVPGRLQILVTATYRGLTATGLIDQMIELPPGAKAPAVRTSQSSGKWKWVLLGIAAAGGVGAAIYLTHGNSKPAPVSISAGSVTFGNP